MLAAVFHGARDVRVEEVAEPGPPGEGDVLLQTIFTSICGTDVAEYMTGPIMIPRCHPHPGSGHTGPTIIGHEVLGRVIAVGPNVDQGLIGTRVVPGAGVWCGTCSWCRSGRFNLCARYYTLGLHANGGLAERMVAPASMCVPVPEECSDRVAVLGQSASIAVHAMRRGQIASAMPLGVVGAGGVGSLVVLVARAWGVGHIGVVEASLTRRDRALHLGADDAGDPAAPDSMDRLLRLTSGEGFPVVLEASGTEGGLMAAVSLVRRGGRVVLLGLQSGRPQVDLHRLVLDEVELTTSAAHLCPHDLPEALAMLAGAARRADTLIDRVISLDELVPRGLEPLSQGAVDGKIVVNPVRA